MAIITLCVNPFHSSNAMEKMLPHLRRQDSFNACQLESLVQEFAPRLSPDQPRHLDIYVGLGKNDQWGTRLIPLTEFSEEEQMFAECILEAHVSRFKGRMMPWIDLAAPIRESYGSTFEFVFRLEDNQLTALIRRNGRVVSHDFRHRQTVAA